MSENTEGFQGKMQTRAERLAELEKKKRIEQENNEKITKGLNSFLSDLNAIKNDIKQIHRVSLENTLNEVKNELKKAIPNEIKVIKENKTDKVTYKFLWWYFAISSIISVGSISYAAFTAYHWEQEKTKIFTKGANAGADKIFYELPLPSKKYLKKTHPYFKNHSLKKE